MSIQELINNDIKKAMLAREVDKLAALRSVKSAVLLEASKDGRREVSDEVVLRIITKLVKQRRDSAQIYKEQNRKDLENDELEQLKHLEFYLPEQLSEDEVRLIIDKIIHDSEASSISDMGRVMGVATKELSGRADGKLIATLVREILK
ncbi:MAG: GatB/YqeY domain-containing protein [Flavobacteriales bacterium]|jgi:uncharacterized protein|nr:GatB/YqeY domain-containing protein [Flavobacteriales bacterium]